METLEPLVPWRLENREEEQTGRFRDSLGGALSTDWKFGSVCPSGLSLKGSRRTTVKDGDQGHASHESLGKGSQGKRISPDKAQQPLIAPNSPGP